MKNLFVRSLCAHLQRCQINILEKKSMLFRKVCPLGYMLKWHQIKAICWLFHNNLCILSPWLLSTWSPQFIHVSTSNHVMFTMWHDRHTFSTMIVRSTAADFLHFTLYVTNYLLDYHTIWLTRVGQHHGWNSSSDNSVKGWSTTLSHSISLSMKIPSYQ